MANINLKHIYKSGIKGINNDTTLQLENDDYITKRYHMKHHKMSNKNISSLLRS